ncbi:MAG TPA: extensin family protein [Polyangiaceae bacterium]|nr:extensin family protein [Polyangiaceae bacterium]
MAGMALLMTYASESPARRRRTNPLVVFPSHPERLRAVRYAQMERERCEHELLFRGVSFGAAPETRGVEAPVVLTGPLRGVRFVRAFGAERAPSLVMDCRLAVALDDLAIVAGDRGIVEVRYSSVHRPRKRGRVSGHSAGVAIDVNEFVRKDGEVLNVLDDFEGASIGSRTCGDGAPQPKSAKAIELRALVCAIDESSSFNLVLTPHYDRRHKNHLHLEVRRGIEWFLTQ